MIGIDGNITATIQIKAVKKDESGQPVKDKIGAQVIEWTDAQKITGWLDLMSGNSGYSAYSAKIQESTHIFLCDYVPLVKGVEAEKARAVIGTKTYDIMLIDNPMELCEQLEFYLKYTGGQ